MSRKTWNNPDQFELDLAGTVDDFIDVKCLLQSAMEKPVETPNGDHNDREDCNEVAAAVKHSLRDSRMSREQLVDGINTYFGRTEDGAKADPPTCRNPLTIHMLNNYLSKPWEYPLPAYYLYAIHHVTGTIEPGATIVAAEGAQVVTADDLHLLNLGKLQDTIDDLQRLRKEMKGRKR